MATPTLSPLSSAEIVNIMEWIPVVFVTFKALVLGIGMFFAVKWHYDQGKKGKENERSAVLRMSAKVAAGFVLLLIGLGIVTFLAARMLGLDLTMP
jgi:heme A synthase